MSEHPSRLSLRKSKVETMTKSTINQHQELMDSRHLSQHGQASSKITVGNTNRSISNHHQEHLDSRHLSQHRQDTSRIPSEHVGSRHLSQLSQHQQASANIPTERLESRHLSQHQQASAKFPTERVSKHIASQPLQPSAKFSTEHVSEHIASLHRQASAKIPSEHNLPPQQPRRAESIRVTEKERHSPSPFQKSHPPPPPPPPTPSPKPKRHHSHRSPKPHHRRDAPAGDQKKEKGRRIEDNEYVPDLLWFFSGGTGMPPKIGQLRDKKAREEEYVARKRGEVEPKKRAGRAERDAAREDGKGGVRADVQEVSWAEEEQVRRRESELEEYEKKKLQKICEKRLTYYDDI